MITDEQIKNLKSGDPLIIHGTFDGIYSDGDISVRVKSTDVFSDEVLTEVNYFHPSCVSIPSEKPLEIFHTTKIPEVYPKYDPCRMFKEGDIVEPSEINGRLPQELRGCYRYEVIVGEGEMTNPLYVTVKPLLEANYKHLSEIHVNAAFLKLVTPVEELEPYRVETGGYNKFRIKKGNLEYSYFPFGEHCVLSMDEAKAAAEAECARLNAEYRKEQNNG